jgi:hypothetical protein
VTDGKWPWPADSPLERRTRATQIYRHALETVAPEACAALDAQMIAAGQPWAVPNRDPYEPTDLLTAQLAADLLHVARRTIYSWRYKGLKVIETPDGPRYRVADLKAFVNERRRRRLTR